MSWQQDTKLAGLERQRRFHVMIPGESPTTLSRVVLLSQKNTARFESHTGQRLKSRKHEVSEPTKLPGKNFKLSCKLLMQSRIKPCRRLFGTAFVHQQALRTLDCVPLKLRHCYLVGLGCHCCA